MGLQTGGELFGRMPSAHESECSRSRPYEPAALKEMETRLSYLHPRHKLQEQQQRLAELEDELRQMMNDRVKEARYRLAIQIEKMNGLSPIRKLNQGFSYVEEADGSVIKSIRQSKKR